MTDKVIAITLHAMILSLLSLGRVGPTTVSLKRAFELQRNLCVSVFFYSFICFYIIYYICVLSSKKPSLFCFHSSLRLPVSQPDYVCTGISLLSIPVC